MKIMKIFRGLNIISQEFNKDMSVINFYNMLRWYNTKSNNIAVINNRKAFNNIIKHLRNNLDKKREDKVIKVNDDKYLFVVNETDRYVVYIENISDLDKLKINFGKYV